MAVPAKLVDQWSDPRWRLNNLYWITDEDGMRIPFRMNWAQEKFFSDLHYLNIVLKARQLGFTTFILLYMLDSCIFNDNIRAGTIAHNREDAEAYFRDKVKFPYDNLDEGLKAVKPAKQDSARQLTFENNSSIRVGTSMRSGTLQYLHVSEYGKTCAKFPEKAKEIKTGAFNTVHAGQEIFVESTAEGQGGHFFEMCEEARTLQRRGVDLTPLDFKFHFFPWFQHPNYYLPTESTKVDAEIEKYFAKLYEDHGIALRPDQHTWYARKSAQMGTDMKREFPSTPDEAFEAAIEGAYYAHEMARVEAEGRICDLALERGLPVDTWWDLGISDLMSVIFTQRVENWIHVVDYYQESNYGLEHYANMLQEKQRARGWVYGTHVWPHDGNTRVLDAKGNKKRDIMRDLGYDPHIVKRTTDVLDGIEQVRTSILPKCKFDAKRTTDLTRALKNYRAEWDEDLATFRKVPLHNWASHPADAMRTGAEYRPKKDRKPLVYPERSSSSMRV